MITLLKGDSATSRFGRQLNFVVDTTLDTSGCSVRFSLNGIVAEAELVGSDATVQLSVEQTEKLDYGVGFAAIALVAGENVCTVKNDIAVRVTDCVADVSGGGNTVDIRLKGSWDDALEGVSWDAGGSIGSLREFLSRVGAVLGASVTTR